MVKIRGKTKVTTNAFVVTLVRVKNAATTYLFRSVSPLHLLPGVRLEGYDLPKPVVLDGMMAGFHPLQLARPQAPRGPWTHCFQTFELSDGVFGTQPTENQVATCTQVMAIGSKICRCHSHMPQLNHRRTRTFSGSQSQLTSPRKGTLTTPRALPPDASILQRAFGNHMGLSWAYH